MSLRKELIKSKISQIFDSLNFIEENLPLDFGEFSKSRLIRSALYKEVEFCIELVLDICSIINSDLKLGMPQSEEDILNNLVKGEVFDSSISDIVRKMKGFRNVLVHKYGEVDDELSYENICSV
jgi:uncharacterized protein YutE (UPF0331/DUF86 family)